MQKRRVKDIFDYELSSKFRSKQDFGTYLSQDRKLSTINIIINLNSSKICSSSQILTKDFFKDVFAERKELLDISEVKHINVPHYPELNVKVIYEHYKNDALLKKFLPDKLAKGRQMDRTFFFNVFNTLYPDQLGEMVQNDRTQ